jgi:hypothetical protein
MTCSLISLVLTRSEGSLYFLDISLRRAESSAMMASLLRFS